MDELEIYLLLRSWRKWRKIESDVVDEVRESGNESESDLESVDAVNRADD